MNNVIDVKNNLNDDDLEVIEKFKEVFSNLGGDLKRPGRTIKIIDNFSDSKQEDFRIKLLNEKSGRRMLVGLTSSAEMFWWTFDSVYTSVRIGYSLKERKEIIEEFKDDVVSLMGDSDFEEKIYELNGRPVYKELHFNKGGIMSKSLVIGGGILKRFANSRKA